jgi:acyl-homoserine-lactone acylase
MKDEYLRIDQLGELASAYVVIDAIAEAAPPTTQTPTQATPTRAQIKALGTRLGHGGIGGGDGAMGSNAIAIGKNGNRDHTHGLLLGTPHFPWVGTERLYQMQLTVPGHMDVAGASLYGLPLVLVGHTANVAWSHTTSTAFRFVPLQLTLSPSSPTSYVVDGKTYTMTSQDVTVDTGSGDVTRTLYATKYGPIFNNLEGHALDWTSDQAYALYDANASNMRLLNHFFRIDEAQSVPDVLKILKSDEGLPWVNTIAADRDGRALYADIGSIPNVSDKQEVACATGIGTITFNLLGLPVLDASRSACLPATSKQAAAPGIFPASELPYLVRSDYVTNSNDSYWLSNPQHPLTGFSRIIGAENTERSLRTRSGLAMVQARLKGTDGEGKPGFNNALMRKLEFSNIQYGATLAKTATVKMCKAFPGGLAPTSDGSTVPVGDACTTLAAWNGRENIDSRGAVLWRAFWEKALNVPNGPWKNVFTGEHPLTTPNTLDPDSDVQDAFGDALAMMNTDNLPFNVALGTVQYVVRNGKHIPLHGGPGDPDGEFNAVDQNVFDPATRGTPPTIGTSYVQVTTWHSHDRIVCASGQKKWVHEAFCAKQVKAQAISTKHLTGTAS